MNSGRQLVLAAILALVPAIAQQSFYQVSIDQDKLGGAADFSFLNHPLTPADRLFVRDGHFYRVGADLKPNTSDDQRVRLFGVNLAFGANFPEESDAPRIAKRLRRLGVNLVRCHHMDSSPDRDPANANSLLTADPYPTLNPISVVRLRRFLDALAAEGIYINLNLHVGYQFRPAVDRVPALDEFPKQSKPLHIFYPRMVDLQLDYTRKVIRALKLKDDPVLAMVEIDNESSLLESWQRGNLDKYAHGDYAAELEKQWRAFPRAEGPLVRAADAATDGRADRYLLFLADRDRSYLKRMLGAVRETTDALVPVAGTQMGYGGLLNLDSHADLDYQDNHFYIDHYAFPHTAWDARDWRIRDTSSVATGLAAFLNMAAARESGRPYTVSEYNQPWPNRQAAEIDPTLAAFAAFQDWDSIMHFAYSHARRWDNTVPGGFDINGDWTKFPNLGQSAWLFRAGAVQAAETEVRIAVTPEWQLKAGRERKLGNIAAMLPDARIALVHRVGLTKGSAKAAHEVAPPYRSDTGELIYDAERKLYILQAAKAAGVFGYAGQAKVAAGAIEVQLAPSARGFATILVTALDDKPIPASARLLISTPGYTLAHEQKLVNYPGAGDWWTISPEPGSDKPSGNRNGGAAPVWMERVESTMTLHSTARKLSVFPLDGRGERLSPVAGVKHAKDTFVIPLQADGQTLAPWYEVAAER